MNTTENKTWQSAQQYVYRLADQIKTTQKETLEKNFINTIQQFFCKFNIVDFTCLQTAILTRSVSLRGGLLLFPKPVLSLSKESNPLLSGDCSPHSHSLCFGDYVAYGAHLPWRAVPGSVGSPALPLSSASGTIVAGGAREEQAHLAATREVQRSY